MRYLQQSNLQRQKEQWLPEARCRKNGELLLNDTISTWADEKVLEVVVVIFAQQCKYLMPPTCTLEMVKTVISCYVSPFLETPTP